MIKSIFIYSIIFLSSIIMFCKSKNSNRLKSSLFFLCGVGIPVLLSGVRYGIGVDYFSYVSIYEKVKNYNILEYLLSYLERLDNIEFLYMVLNRIVYLVFDNVQYLFLLTGLITILLFTYTFKKNSHIEISFAVFIFFMVYYHPTYNLIRMMIASAILFYSYEMIMEKKLLRYCIAVIIAALFHRSALIAIVFYIFKPIKYKHIRNVLYSISLLCSPLILELMIYLISNISYFKKYFIRYQIEFSSPGFGFLIPILPVLIPILIYKKNIINIDVKYDVLINIFLLQIPFGFLNYWNQWANRLNFYTSTTQLILVPLLISSISKNKEKLIIKMYFITYYLLYYFYYFIYVNHHGTYPFSSFF